MRTKKKRGAVAFFLGLGLLAVALVASILIGAIAGGPLVVAALFLVGYGLMAKGPTAAGKHCTACRRAIDYEYEAELCERCHHPVHAACAGEHAAREHPSARALSA